MSGVADEDAGSRFVAHRPSDALEHALGEAVRDDRWRGDKRLGRIGVKQLVALRALGWDVVRKEAHRGEVA